MLIEYRIRYNEDGVTVSQRIEQDTDDTPNVVAQSQQNSALTKKMLADNIHAQVDEGAGINQDSDDLGRGDDDSPVVILGAVILRRGA